MEDHLIGQRHGHNVALSIQSVAKRDGCTLLEKPWTLYHPRYQLHKGRVSRASSNSEFATAHAHVWCVPRSSETRKREPCPPKRTPLLIILARGLLVRARWLGNSSTRTQAAAVKCACSQPLRVF